MPANFQPIFALTPETAFATVQQQTEQVQQWVTPLLY